MFRPRSKDLNAMASGAASFSLGASERWATSKAAPPGAASSSPGDSQPRTTSSGAPAVLRVVHLCELQNCSCERTACVAVVDSRRAFEDLDHGTRSRNLEDLTLSLRAILQSQVDDFSKFWLFHILNYDQRTVHTADGLIHDSRLYLRKHTHVAGEVRHESRRASKQITRIKTFVINLGLLRPSKICEEKNR